MSILQQQYFEAGKGIKVWPITGKKKKKFPSEEAQPLDLVVKELKSTILKYAQRRKENCV